MGAKACATAREATMVDGMTSSAIAAADQDASLSATMRKDEKLQMTALWTRYSGKETQPNHNESGHDNRRRRNGLNIGASSKHAPRNAPVLWPSWSNR